MTTKSGVRRGSRVETSGEGRTANWPHSTGTVTRASRGSVFVYWDGAHFEDEMDAAEVRPIAGRGDPSDRFFVLRRTNP